MTGFAGWIAWGAEGDAAPDLLSAHARRFAMALDSPLAEAPEHWQQDGVLFTHRASRTAPEDAADYQPRVSHDAPFLLLFDGYLANRADLIQALALPTEAAAWPDSALTLAALEKWGEGAALRLIGDFALALWDRQQRRLLLARDTGGTRPLYYHRGDGFLAFATNPRALLALPDVPRTLNEARFALHLVDGTAAPGDSFYAAIRQVPAAHYARMTATTTAVHSYWELDYHRRLSFKTDAEYINTARALLDQAVAAALRIEGPPVAALTGGLDSTAVALTALKFLPGGRLTTVTSVPDDGVPVGSRPGSYTDERPYIEALARANPGLTPLLVPASGPHHWDAHARELFLRTGVPWRNIMNLGWIGASQDRARSLGARVLLTGFVGNITLSWDGRNVLPDYVRRGRLAYPWREVRAIARRSGNGVLREIWRNILAPLLPRTVLARIAALRGQVPPLPYTDYSALHPDLLAQPQQTEVLHQFERVGAFPSAVLRRLAFENWQSSAEFVGLGRAAHGLEQRGPLGDRRLLEFCFAVPDTQYLRNGVHRRLARQVLADRLPPIVLNNPARGFQCPEYFYRMQAQRTALAETLEDLEYSPLANRLLNVPRLRALMDAWPTSAADAPPAYMAVLHRGLHYAQFLRWLEGGNR